MQEWATSGLVMNERQITEAIISWIVCLFCYDDEVGDLEWDF